MLMSHNPSQARVHRCLALGRAAALAGEFAAGIGRAALEAAADRQMRRRQQRSCLSTRRFRYRWNCCGQIIDLASPRRGNFRRPGTRSGGLDGRGLGRSTGWCLKGRQLLQLDERFEIGIGTGRLKCDDSRLVIDDGVGLWRIWQLVMPIKGGHPPRRKQIQQYDM